MSRPLLAWLCIFVLPQLPLTNSLAAPVAPDQRDPTKEEIAEAWAKRPSVVGPFQYRVELTELNALPKTPKATNDPFDHASEEKSGRYATVKKTLVMKKDGEKVWTSEEGDHFDMDTGQVFGQRIYRSFNGSTYRWFAGGSRLPFHLAGIRSKDVRKRPWRMTSYFQPMLVWANPLKELSSIGPHLEHAQMSAKDRDISGAGHLQLEVTGEQNVKYSLQVSRAYPYLPIQLVFRDLKQRETRRLERRYETDETGNPRLVSWSDASFDTDGYVTRQVDAKVTEFVHGKPLTDQDFALAFPVGAHIIKDGGWVQSYWLQKTPDKMEPMKQKDYGRLPKKPETEKGPL
jgi:hypothetical protein